LRGAFVDTATFTIYLSPVLSIYLSPVLSKS
jgi:hypothetical protein